MREKKKTKFVIDKEKSIEKKRRNLKGESPFSLKATNLYRAGIRMGSGFVVQGS